MCLMLILRFALCCEYLLRSVLWHDFACLTIGLRIWVEKVSPHDCWARIREWNGGRWARLYTRCREYMDVY